MIRRAERKSYKWVGIAAAVLLLAAVLVFGLRIKEVSVSGSNRYTPEQIIGRLAYACGLQNAPDPRTPAELADGFSWQRVPQNDIILPEGLF